MKRILSLLLTLVCLSTLVGQTTRSPVVVIQRQQTMVNTGAWSWSGSNARFSIPSFASAPSSPSNGMLYYNTTTSSIRAYLNGVWITAAPTGGVTYPIALNLGGTGTALGNGSAGNLIRSDGAGAVAWSTLTFPATSTINQLLYSSAANVVGGLATGNYSLLQTGATGVPAWGSITGSRALVTDVNGVVIAATTTAAEIGYVNGVSSAIQNQLDNKQALDGTLTAFAGLTIGTNELVYGTGADAFSMLAVNATGTNKFLRQVSSGAPSWEELAAGDIPDISATYQPLDADLTTLAASTAWRVFYSNGSSVITELVLGANGTFLESNGASTAPAFRTLLAADIPDISGTTGAIGATLVSLAGLTETNGGIPYGTADNAYAWLGAGAEGTLLMGNGAGAPSFLGAGTAGYFLIANGAADPVWTTQPTLTSLEGLTFTNGDVIYATGADALAVLDHGTSGYVLQANGVGAPSWLDIVNSYQPLDADLTTLAAPTTWRMFYSDGSNVITEFVLGANGTFLESNGANAAPAYRTLTVSDLTALTANRAVQTGAGGILEVATTTSTELGYVNGVTGAIQGQIDAKDDTDWNEALGSDGTYEGQTASVTVGENVVFGEVIVKKSDGEYYLTDADAVTTMPGQLIALETKGDGQACLALVVGYIREDDWNWTVGDGQANLLFPDDGTPGAMVQQAAKPSDSGDQLQVIGRVITADCIYFYPSYVLVEVN